MTMRITFNQVRDGLDAINTAAEQFAEAQWQVSTGRRVRVPSDDPAAAQRAVNEQATIDQIDAYKATASSATTRLAALDSVLGDIVEKITQALVAAQSAVGSTATEAVRSAAAETLSGVRDAVAADINTNLNGTFLFGGTESGTAPYAAGGGGWAYQGNGDPVVVDIGDGRSVAVAMSGEAVLKGSDPTDLLSTLESLITAVRAGDSAAVVSGIGLLNNAQARVGRAQSQVGRDQVAVEDGAARLGTLRTASMARLSQDQDANLAEAITRMNRGQTTYQAALGAVAASSKVSLMDYLK